MILYDEVLLKTVTTITNITVIAIIASLSFYLLKRRTTTVRQAKKLKSRIIYISIIFIFLALIKIWVGGLIQLLTMLSLVAAGLIIVNKETVMNFVGWIIINWRSLFAEDDYVQVQNYHGCIKEIKLFYFRMYETVEHGDKRITGKLIKLPNAIVITNPISTFTSDKNIIFHKIPYLINTGNDINKFIEKANTIIREIIIEKYQFNEDFTKSSIISKNKLKTCGINSFSPEIEIKTLVDKENIVNIQASFYCYIEDKKEIEKLYVQKFIQEIKSAPSS